MAFTPLSEVHLVELELDIDNKNQLTFSTQAAQLTYFNGLTFRKNYTNLTYVRKDNYIVVPDNVDDIYKYNYLYYKNTDTSSKWYFAYIVKAEWLSEHSSKVYIKTDVWQTYQFNIDFKKSFVEREMINVADDIAGSNLEPEDLETGEYIQEENFSLSGFGICYVLACGRDPATISGTGASTSTYHGNVVNNIASGLWYYIGNYTRVLGMIQTIVNAGYPDDIVSIYSIPTCAIYGWSQDYTIEELDDPNEVWGFWCQNFADFDGLTWDVAIAMTNLNGYTPRNKKLLQYPFCYLGFNAPNGATKIFRYENFTAVTGTSNARFQIISEVNPNPNVYLIPYKYRESGNYNPHEAVVFQGYPNIGYSTDYFSGWIAQNQNLLSIDYQRQDLNYDMSMSKQVLNYASGIANSVGQITSGNIGAGIGTAIEQSGGALLNTYGLSKNYDLDIQTRQAQIEKQQMLPNKASLGGGSNATLIGYGYLKWSLFARYCIKPFFAARIDDYFDMFGYKTNSVKIPNINNRPNWNYIKTLGCIIQSKPSTTQVDNTVLQEDMQELKAMFDNGITLWHNPSTFLDYSQSNR